MIAVLRICTRVDWKRKWFEVKGQRSPPQRPFEVALIPKYPTNKPAKLLCAIISRIIYFLSFSSSRRDFEISMASIRAEVWMLALEEPPANIWTCCTSGSCVKAANACGARQACEADSLRRQSNPVRFLLFAVHRRRFSLFSEWKVWMCCRVIRLRAICSFLSWPERRPGGWNHQAKSASVLPAAVCKPSFWECTRNVF